MRLRCQTEKLGGYASLSAAVEVPGPDSLQRQPLRSPEHVGAPEPLFPGQKSPLVLDLGL